jgi:hypothetical protein
MALIETGTTETTKALARVSPYRNSLRVSASPVGPSYAVSAISGTIGAALAANSTVFSARFGPGADPLKAYVARIVISWTTIAAFTTPVTAGRRLAVFRGSGATPSAQTAIAAGLKKNNLDPNSRMQTSMAGDIRISGTGGITTTGITFETDPVVTMLVTDLGTAGASRVQTFQFDRSAGSTFVLQPGELIAIRNPQAMDAGGTWQFSVAMDWYEV